MATISAHEQVGLDAMHQAGAELRRTLEDKGVQLHSLDLQLGAGGHDFSNQGDAREASSGRRGAASSHDLDSDDSVAEDELTITHAPLRRPQARSSTSRPDTAVPRGRILMSSTTGITNTYTNPACNMDDKSASSSLDKNGFLKMLTEQMRNQDPTSGRTPTSTSRRSRR